MKVSIFSQFYPPEMEPTGFMIKSLAKYLSQKNEVDSIDVICGFPNFPSGKFIDRKWYQIFRVSSFKKFKLINVLVFPSDNKNNFKRIINYLSYMISSFFFALFNTKKDIYIASSPPIFVAISCLAIAKLKRGKFILDVRDIWPESAIQMGSLNNKFVIKIFEYIEIILYKNADEIIVATPGMSKIIEKKLNSNNLKISYIPCGIDIPKLEDISLKNSANIINKKKFSVLYAGLHGHAQNLSVICETAIKLKEKSNIHFYLIGDGPDKLNLTQNPKYSNLKNLSFYDPVSRDEIRSIFQEVSCALVPLKDLKIFKNVFPSKTFELWSFGVPTIVGVGGEIDSIIENYSCGVVAEPDNPDSYKDSILSLYEDEERLKKISKSCRNVAATKFSYESCNKDFLNIIKRVQSYD